MIDLAPTTERTSAVVAAVTDDQLDAPTPMGQPVSVVVHHLLGLSLAFRDAAAKVTGPTTSTPPVLRKGRSRTDGAASSRSGCARSPLHGGRRRPGMG